MGAKWRKVWGNKNMRSLCVPSPWTAECPCLYARGRTAGDGWMHRWTRVLASVGPVPCVCGCQGGTVGSVTGNE